MFFIKNRKDGFRIIILIGIKFFKTFSISD
jgi:hypothetical protein